MEVVTLKNGAQEAKVLVAVVLQGLERLFMERPGAAVDLVAFCRDSTHEFFGTNGATLTDSNWLVRTSDRYVVHDSDRNVILSAVEGDGLEMTLGNPIAIPATTEKHDGVHDRR